MDNHQFIGKRIPVIDAPEKVTGEAKYTGDLKFPHMLYGKILRSPHPHAKILNIDVSRAQKIPGVKAVVTAEQTPKKKVGTFVVDQFFLAVDKVRYIGEEVAAVTRRPLRKRSI
jgi:CO/xanthine dehydrogenase Mo-binding subunit